MRAYWGEGTERLLANVEELSEVIAHVQSLDRPIMLFLTHPSGKILVLGLGHRESVLSFFEDEVNCYHSVGDTSRTGTLHFWCRDQLDEFFAEMAVPQSSAIDAAMEFAERGTAPSNVKWERDW